MPESDLIEAATTRLSGVTHPKQLARTMPQWRADYNNVSFIKNNSGTPTGLRYIEPRRGNPHPYLPQFIQEGDVLICRCTSTELLYAANYTKVPTVPVLTGFISSGGRRKKYHTPVFSGYLVLTADYPKILSYLFAKRYLKHLPDWLNLDLHRSAIYNNDDH